MFVPTLTDNVFPTKIHQHTIGATFNYSGAIVNLIINSTCKSDNDVVFSRGDLGLVNNSLCGVLESNIITMNGRVIFFDINAYQQV